MPRVRKLDVMGVLVSIEPRNGATTYRKPSHSLDLACGCDWGKCDRPGIAWRWSTVSRLWLVVCARCVDLPPK